MRSKTEIEKAIAERQDMELLDGDGISGAAIFKRGVMRGMTVIWSCLEGWERIEAEVVGYYLYVEGGKVGDEENELPEEFQNVPVLDPVAVEESEFRSFLSAHVDEFDISDNVRAQVPSVGFYDVSA